MQHTPDKSAVRAAQNAHAADVEAWADAEARKGAAIKAAMTAPDTAGTTGMSAGHTKGPWTVGYYPWADGSQRNRTQVEAFCREGEMAGNRTLCALIDSENREADARLIAAAPCMLEALRRAEAAIKYAVAAANSEADYVRLCEIQDAARAAIARATGGAA